MLYIQLCSPTAAHPYTRIHFHRNTCGNPESPPPLAQGTILPSVPYWKYIKNIRNMTNFVTSLSILRGHFDHSTSQPVCNRVFWLKPRLWESGHHRESGILTGAGGSRLQLEPSWSPELGILLEPAARASSGIGSRFRKRRLRVPDSSKELNCGSDSQFGIG